MNRDDVEIKSIAPAYKGYFAVDEYKLRIRQFDGAWSEEFSRELFRSGPAVVVILYDPRRDAVVLVEQFRIGPYSTGEACWVLEFVAGKIDDGEQADDVARRETKEESGCDITRLERVADYFVSPGSLDETVTMYVAEVESKNAAGTFGLAEEHEDIRVHVMPADEVIAMADAGTLVNVNTYAGALWLARHRDALRERWLK